MKNMFIAFIIGALMAASSCSDFLNVDPPGSIVDKNVTSEALSATYIGAYSTLTDWFNSYAYPGYRSNLLMVDALGEDLIGTNGAYGGVTAQYKYLSANSITSGVAATVWSRYYATIKNCNNGLALYQGIESPTSENKVTAAQLMALRALCYFDIVRLWQKTYEVGKDLLVCPIYIEKTTIENAKMGKELSTVGAVYEQIVNDLTAADNLFEEVGSYVRPSKEYINRNVVNALLARVYLTKGTKTLGGLGVKEDMDRAVRHAAKAQEGMSLMSQNDFLAGFNDINNPEWLLGLSQTADYKGMTYAFHYLDTRIPGDKAAPSYKYESYAYYKSAKPDPYFKKLFDYGSGYDVNDVRFKIFQDPDPNAQSNVRNVITYPKFTFNSEFRGDILFMRLSEMLLIEAEAILRGGNPAVGSGQNATEIINRLRSARGASTVGTADLNFVLDERRRELWGEGATGIFDINRLRKTLVRKRLNKADFPEYAAIRGFTGGHYSLLTPQGEPFKQDDSYYFLQLPEAERLNNPMITIVELPRK